MSCNKLFGLEPKSVFTYFEELSAIPHGSGNTKQISDYLVRFAQERGLEHYQDELNNVIIIKEATPGYEDAPAVILQGHIDMVCDDQVGHQLGGDGIAGLGLAVLTGIAEIGDHGGDAAGRGALQSVDHDEQFHQVVIDGRAGGLNNEQIGRAHV